MRLDGDGADPAVTGRATMLHVAALAGVSLKTVSRVVNDEGGVSPELADRVREAVERLGYRQHLGASNLRRGRRTASIGVLVQDLSNDFCGDLLRAVETRARDRGVVVISASVDDEPERERALVAGLVSRRCDGLILMPASDDNSYLDAEVAAGLGVVLVDRGGESATLDSVTVDNRGGAAHACRHLLDQGHRRIACLVDDLGIPTASERRAGYRDAMALEGLSVREVGGIRTSADAQAAVAGLLRSDEPPTALFCGRNVITIGAVRALRDARMQRQVALVGFDDFSTADLLEPAITTIRQDAAAEGAAAFDLLIERLDGHAGPRRALVLDTELITRGSGEIPGPG